jgi:radical SAM superfamily enzyme YgiQ (UPF0313 family)
MAVDSIVRGEGEVTFRELLRALENGCGFEAIPGLSYRKGKVWQPNRPRNRYIDCRTAKSGSPIVPLAYFMAIHCSADL